MIEFKARCGHTVRAEDPDEGGVVRCSYCGRTVPVPFRQNDLTYLFRDAETPPPEERKRWWQPFARKAGQATVSVFPLAFKLFYVAVLIGVVVVVARRFVLPMFEPDALTRRFEAEHASRPAGSAPEPVDSGIDGGLITEIPLEGMYVLSTPPGASVICGPQQPMSAWDRSTLGPRGIKFLADGRPAFVPDGTYMVEVAMPLKSLKYPSIGGRAELRRLHQILNIAEEREREKQLARFFWPDGAALVFALFTGDDEVSIVRQFRDVKIENGKSPGVRALFLPRVYKREQFLFDVELLVRDYLPSQQNYRFDEEHVGRGILYSGAMESDVPHIVEALKRIGVLGYATPDGSVRLFAIGIHDASFEGRLLTEIRP